MSSIMGGTVFRRHVDGWDVSWESAGRYRHWCRQEKPGHSETIVIVLKNPGSLSGDGSNLRRDSTLRILREVGERASVNWLVLNLFDLATPKPAELHDCWQEKDAQALVFHKVDLHNVRLVLFAHGDLGPDHKADYQGRIATVRNTLASLRQISIPTTHAGYPMHPMNWQRQRLMSDVVEAIVAAKEGA